MHVTAGVWPGVRRSPHWDLPASPALGFKDLRTPAWGGGVLPAGATGQAGSRPSGLHRARTVSTHHPPALPAPALTSARVLTQAKSGGSSGSKEPRPQAQSQCPKPPLPGPQEPPELSWPEQCSREQHVPGPGLIRQPVVPRKGVGPCSPLRGPVGRAAGPTPACFRARDSLSAGGPGSRLPSPPCPDLDASVTVTVPRGRVLVT